MREFSTPATFELPTTGNLTDDVVSNARDFPRTVVFSRPGAAGWEDVTSEQFLAEVTAVAKGLVAAGIEQGDRVALFSKTRYEWTLLDYAIWFAGAVTVPVYETSSTEQIAWILSDSGAVAAVVESAEHYQRVGAVRGELSDLADQLVGATGAHQPGQSAQPGVQVDFVRFLLGRGQFGELWRLAAGLAASPQGSHPG